MLQNLTHNALYSCVSTPVGKTCDKLTVPNAKNTNAKDAYEFGESVTYECDPGYKFKGGSSVTCTGENEWSEPTPECQGRRIDRQMNAR